MSTWTEPAYGLPYTIESGETVTFAFSAGSSSGFVASLTAGDYYTADLAPGSLLSQVRDDIFAQDSTTNPGVVWDPVADVATGLSFRSLLRRTGLSGDLVSTITFSSAATAQALGFPAAVLTTSNGLTNAAPVCTVEGVYQRGHLWVPRAPLTYPRVHGTATTATSRTNGGAVVLDGYGRLTRHEHTHQIVCGALVKISDVNNTGHVSRVPGLVVGDPNVPLEALWRILVDGFGAIPVVRYYPDTAALATYTDLRLDMSAWWANFVEPSAVTEVNEAPLVYRVVLMGHEA